MSESIEKIDTFVLFGVLGDLSIRKLIPAWYYLERDGKLTDSLKILGVGRRLVSDDELRDKVKESLKTHVSEEYIDNENFQTIYAKRGLFEEDKNRSPVLVLFDGENTIIKNNEITNIGFSKFDLNLSNTKTNTITYIKTQELTTLNLLRCLKLINKINYDLENKLGLSKDEFKLGGILILFNNLLQSLFKSQILTLGLVMVGIFIMFMILFRNYNSHLKLETISLKQ